MQTGRLSALDRYLTLWIFLGMAVDGVVRVAGRVPKENEVKGWLGT